MFKSKKTIIDPNKTDTLIGAGTTFEGKLESNASIRIEGKVTGDITSSGDVIISEDGSAHSQIQARCLIVAGQLVGNVKISGQLTICATGSLLGNIEAESFIIEAGGIFNGTSSMTTNTANTADVAKNKRQQATDLVAKAN